MKDIFKAIVVSILTFEAKVLLRRKRPKIVGITGSVGKTSVKDAVYAVLKDYEPVRKSEKSFNSDIGVPLTILGLQTGWSNPLVWLKNIVEGFLIAFFTRTYPKILVLEMGVDRPGDMSKLTSWITPDIVVLTRFPTVPVHVEFFSSPRDVVNEKMVLAHALAPDGVLIYNNDDELIVEAIEGIRQQKVGYSRYSESDFQASGDAIYYDGEVPAGIEFDLKHGDKEARFRVQGSLGVQHVYNYAAGAAVGDQFGIALEDAMASLTSHTPPPGRMRILKGLKDTVILDDTYNSSPVAAERALMTLGELKGRRRIAVLGDMLELGQFSTEAHEELGALVSKHAQILVTLGVRARKIAEGALEHRMSEKKIFQYDDVLRAANELQQMLKPGDVVLVKASQGIRAEKLVEEIMAEPQKAEELLVRQDPYWKEG